MQEDRVEVGDVLELRYEHPAVCDTYIAVVVERLQPKFILRLLVLYDSLGDFEEKLTILCTDWKLKEWLVKRWS